MTSDPQKVEENVHWVMTRPDGSVKDEGKAHNIITQVGDQMYGERGAGIGSPPAIPTGMKLGTGSTAVAKTGAGAAIVTYLTNSHQAIATPTSGLNGAVRRITYVATYAAGKATTASAITEAVLVNETLTDAAGAGASATIARVLLTGIGSKGASDTLTITWTHDIGT